MADDVILTKAEMIENCIRRIKEEYADNADNLRENFTKQDSILLNLERCCQAAIDLAMRIVRLEKLGVPKESRDVFERLEKKKIVTRNLAQELQKMVGFRNVAVHAYRELDLDIVESIIKKHLSDFEKFIAIALRLKIGKALRKKKGRVSP